MVVMKIDLIWRGIWLKYVYFVFRLNGYKILFRVVYIILNWVYLEILDLFFIC